MATGRVLQFDHARGYGFIAADDGGEDVFLHASVFDGDPEELDSGKRIEFKVMAGDRGRKAFGVRLIPDDHESRPAESGAPIASGPVVTTAPALAAPADLSDDQLCDVLSTVEFSQEITELLLNNAPDLSGQQIIQVRQSVLEFANKHGWCDG